MPSSRLAHQPVAVDLEPTPQHARGAPQHGLVKRWHVGGALALVAVVLALLGILTWSPSRDSETPTTAGGGPRAVPAGLTSNPVNRWSVGAVSLGEPIAAVFTAIGTPDLVSPSTVRTQMTWRFDGVTVGVLASGDASATVLEIDVRVDEGVDPAPRLARGISLGTSTLGALVGAWGTPVDTGVPAPTSVRFAACRASDTVLVRADAGGWEPAFSHPVRHVTIGFVGDPSSSMCAPGRR